ncbi:MAG: glycoside hydrolase family 97 N-terminal domain-containing protein, partial [Bacteroidales bacterium]|nr:glycoside hydrolase family 97 N-terminal domain-containing protein [Bacteroidales bacterium]
MKVKSLSIVVTLAVLFSCTATHNQSETVSSPEGKNSIQFELLNGVPYYSVSNNGKAVINPSRMGFVFSGDDT